MKKMTCLFFVVVMLFTTLTASVCSVSADREARPLRILFTHDLHSHFLNAEETVNGEKVQYGGAARLKTLLDRNRTESSIYVDGGDFSMGTLLQANYSTDAYELRLLGKLGCDATTFGNHEFDYGDDGVAEMLLAAMRSGDPLPALVQSNMKFHGALTEEQRKLADAMRLYGAKKYVVLERGGLRIAVFGLFGIDCLSCAPTAKMTFTDYVEAAKSTVKAIRAEAEPDVILCLSHSGTESETEGEDVQLAMAVPEIDVILSGHTHSSFEKPVRIGSTL